MSKRYAVTFSYKGKRQNIFKGNQTFKTELLAEQIAAAYGGTPSLRVEEIIVKAKRKKK